MHIEPSAALRKDYGAISKLAHDTSEPIFITVNGKGDLVVMSIEAFERRDEEIRLRAKLDAAEQSRLNGDAGVGIEEARARLNGLYGKYQA